MGLIRRRGMLQEGDAHDWQDIATKPYTSWARQSCTISDDKIVFTPNQLGWGFTLTAQDLRYKWNQIVGKKIRVRYDYSATGMTSPQAQGGNQYFSCAWGLFSVVSPTGAASRHTYQSGATNQNVRDNGSGHVDVINTIGTYSGSAPNGGYYLGARLYAYTGAGSRVEVWNLKIEIDMAS